ncbi:ribonuclease Z [Peptacetobacter hiranonis]|uniref:ribonuclease Z n=1 Tax=Peptacetobacter hiranonis TaxID=89152 RepID=UPI002E774A8C|nr:ribonuclease Z [Peptacetobacter hiranonis]MEE0248874.1 ribonuclease Z [Peptacetobacter hiranonis]
MVNLTLLGCGGNVPLPNRFLSSLFMNFNGRKILVDCGEGTQVSMKMKGCGFKDIDLICITHTHGDHIIGLIGLLSTMGNSERKKTVTIVGPVGIKEAMDAIQVLITLPYKLNIIENPEGRFSLVDPLLSDLSIETIELEHSTECIGYNFYFARHPKFNVEKAQQNNVPRKYWNMLQKGMTIMDDDVNYTPDMVLGDDRKGIKISMITDTRPLDTIPEFIEDADLFICEAMYGDEMDISKAIKNKHMLFREAASLAVRGNAKQLLLTHFSPSIEDPNVFENNAKSVFENTIIGYDRFSTQIKYPE